MKLLKAILGFLKQRWFISLLGLLALSLLIWYLGPLIAIAGHSPLEPAFNRLIGIAGLAGIWLLRQLWKLFNAKRQNQQMIENISTASEPEISPLEQASEEELQILRERMQEAMAVLKKTRVGSRWNRQYLYQLPWYILIGPPGSGKTTLLVNSELKFPLAEQFGNEAIRGVGGTRNCDWWFAENAVLLDTAGRYTTHDSQEEVDSKAWTGFLGLLKKHRRRRPINGAIIAVSLTDLITLNKNQILAHAHAIRERISELHEELGIRFPVYFLFTKADLLAGFMSFFDDLNSEERSQVWGMTFPLSEDPDEASVTRFDDEFSLIRKNLYNRVVERLETERNQEKREQIYTFPQQFDALSTQISAFIHEIFQPNRYQEPAMLRGVYFTSATQEGTPIDRVLGSMARHFGLNQENLSGASGQGKSFFINRLLKNVIFAEHGLAGTNIKLEKKRVWLQRASVATIAAISIITLLGWTTSFFKNVSYTKESQSSAEKLQVLADDFNPDTTDVLSTLDLLNKAQQMSSSGENLPITAHLGLYQGKKLDQAGATVYHRLLKDAFLPRLMTRLEEQIRENGNDIDYLYEALKVYVMLADREHFDKHAIRAWITLDWDNNLPLETTNDQRNALLQHLDELLVRPPVPLPRPLDAGLVADARQMLARAPLAERVYGRLKLELSQTNIDNFTISKAAGSNAALVFSRKSGNPLNQGIPGLYTYDGYHDYFQPESKKVTKNLTDESWILGEQQHAQPSGEQLQSLREDVQKLYLEDFLKKWRVLLGDLRIVPVSSLEEAVQVLSTLSSDQSPLRLLLESVSKETDLDDQVEKADSKITKVKDKLSSAKSKLGKILGKGRGIIPQPRLKFSTAYISGQFSDLHGLVNSKDGQPPLLDGLLKQLDELRIYLSPLVNTSGEEMVLEQRKEIEKKLLKIKSDVQRQPYPVDALLKEAVNSVNDIVGGGVCQHLNALWKNEMLEFCNTAINKRYPFLQHSQTETTQEDFAQFFAPTGMANTFFKTYLASSVDKSTANWHWISNENAPECASIQTLKQFKYAKIIGDTFFRFGAQTPSVGFSLKPISMSEQITQLTLIVDGQKLNYSHGPPQVIPMKWPGPDNSGQVHLQLSPPLSGVNSGISLEGPWALFRLFDKANIRKVGNERFIVTFNIDGRNATFELRANSAFNPFSLPALRNFRCPQSL